MEYIDIADPGIVEFPAVADGIKSGDLVAPVVLVEGQALFEGGIPWRAITRELQRRGIQEKRLAAPTREREGQEDQN